MPKGYMENSSPLLIIKEIQIKPTHIRITITKIKQSASVIGQGGKGASIHCGWECKLIGQLWKPLWWFLKKL
jgi:hypothetical protein